MSPPQTLSAVRLNCSGGLAGGGSPADSPSRTRTADRGPEGCSEACSVRPAMRPPSGGGLRTGRPSTAVVSQSDGSKGPRIVSNPHRRSCTHPPCLCRGVAVWRAPRHAPDPCRMDVAQAARLRPALARPNRRHSPSSCLEPPLVQSPRRVPRPDRAPARSAEADVPLPGALHKRFRRGPGGLRGRFRTARQRGHSANYYGDYPGNNPENHAPAESCTTN